MGRNQQGSGNKGHDFLRAIAGFAEANASPSSSNKPVKLGRVDYEYNPEDFLGGVNPRILFDGESSMSEKRYAVMPPYYPLPGMRVCLIPVGTTYLIIGAVENVPQDPEVQIFTATDTWEKPAGARTIRVQCQGGGGAGGGAASTSSQASVGAGAAGGAYGESWISANVVGSSETVTVGAGGAGASGATGGNGGTSSFGSHVSATGGNGGGVLAAGTTNSAVNGADASGQTVVGDLAIKGSGGGSGFRSSASAGLAGMGGSSFLGSGGRGLGSTGGVSGNPGQGYGGGGGGATNAGTQASGRLGGDGSDGVVIVTTYF